MTSTDIAADDGHEAVQAVDSSKITYTDDDLVAMLRTVWGEARGETKEGQEGVAWVIRNRYEAALAYAAANNGKKMWWGWTIETICQAPWQFSCWNASDPNRHLLGEVSPSLPAYQALTDICRAVLDDLVPDPTKGATYYKTTTLPWPKAWGPEKEPTAVLDHQSFYLL